MADIRSLVDRIGCGDTQALAELNWTVMREVRGGNWHAAKPLVIELMNLLPPQKAADVMVDLWYAAKPEEYKDTLSLLLGVLGGLDRDRAAMFGAAMTVRAWRVRDEWNRGRAK